MSSNDDYTTGNLLDSSYHQNYYKIFGTDLPTQENENILHQINFTGKLEEGDGAKMFFIAEKQQKTNLYFSLDPLIVINGTLTNINLLSEANNFKFVERK